MSENIFDRNSVSKSYFSLALPVVFSMVISIVYNLADTYFISLTKDINLIAGVSLCAPVFTFLMALGNIFGQGGSSLISRLLGQKNYDDIRKVSSFCFYISIILGVITGILMLVFINPLLKVLGADSNTADYAASYYRVMAIGAPLVLLSFIHSNIMRAEGMAKESVYGSVGGSIINVILDPILIFTLNMGITGAALATIIGYVFTDVFCFIIVVKKSKVLSVKISDNSINRDYLGQIMGVGISAALANITQSVCIILTNNSVAEYGNDKIAILGMVMKVSMVVMLLVVGFSFGGAPLVGYFYGSRNFEKLKELLLFVYKFLCGTALGLSLIFIIFSKPIMSIFIKDKELLPEGAFMLSFQVAGMVFMAVVLLSTVTFQAMGKSVQSLILALSRQGVVFIAVLYLAKTIAGLNGIIAAQCISDVLSALLAAALMVSAVKIITGKE